jgi:putative ABC transport system substrate-binding protein
MPVIGFLSSASPGPFARFVHAFRQGLDDGGHVEGRNVAIEYRWVDGQLKFGRKPKLSPYQRAEAIKRRAAGETLASIARSYAVDISMISRLS